ncbi:MAG: hypothetical protein H6709_07760 [Kofleriaceae bacterium]|nr:hypothetical protein [Myxococcales bacterium]MCB9571974.1 hypothetical protein [Kofleriaceae bacterium]
MARQAKGKRRRKGRLRRKRSKEAAGALAVRRPGDRLSVDVRALELACGHDGFLRGEPEPVLVVGAYALAADGCRVLGRAVVRLQRPTGYPCTVAPRGASTLEHVMPPEITGATVAVLVVAIEEDSGRGVQAIYAALERAAHLLVWATGAEVPVLARIDELLAGDLAPWLPGQPVRLMLEGTDASELARGDDWVAAALVAFDRTGRHHDERRLPLCSDDGRNDWTAVLELRA